MLNVLSTGVFQILQTHLFLLHSVPATHFFLFSLPSVYPAFLETHALAMYFIRFLVQIPNLNQGGQLAKEAKRITKAAGKEEVSAWLTPHGH